MPTTLTDRVAELVAAYEKAVRQRELAGWRLKRGKKDGAPEAAVDELTQELAAATREEETVRAALDRERTQATADEQVLQTAPVRGEAIAKETQTLTAEIADHIGAVLVACKRIQVLLAEHDGLQGEYLAAQRRLRPGEKERCLPGNPSGIVSKNAAGRDCLDYLVRLAGSPLLRSEKFSPDRLGELLLR